MSEQTPVRGIVVAHGELAMGLVHAVRRIAGDAADALVAVSNEGCSPQKLSEDLAAVAGTGPLVVFVDLPTGSCAVAARKLCQNQEQRAVIFGANLPLLLDFVFHRDLSLQELVPRLLARGRAGICCSPATDPHGDPALSGR
ncbi:MAG: hypothetical protein HY701_00585 [Gemmatimonadetes bacterium]|nr:hypothetical protein [Gemmatimonadota bacterium]